MTCGQLNVFAAQELSFSGYRRFQLLDVLQMVLTLSGRKPANPGAFKLKLLAEEAVTEDLKK